MDQLKTVSVYEQVLKQLTAAIMHGDLKPRNQLPPKIVRNDGSDRTSLREASSGCCPVFSIKHGPVSYNGEGLPSNVLINFVLKVYR